MSKNKLLLFLFSFFALQAIAQNVVSEKNCEWGNTDFIREKTKVSVAGFSLAECFLAPFDGSRKKYIAVFTFPTDFDSDKFLSQHNFPKLLDRNGSYRKMELIELTGDAYKHPRHSYFNKIANEDVWCFMLYDASIRKLWVAFVD